MEQEKNDSTVGWMYDFDEEYGENNEFVEETPVLSREEQEEQVKQTLLELIMGIAIGAILVMLIGNLILRWNVSFSLGVVIGAVTAVGLAVYMHHSVLVATEYAEKQATNYMRRTTMLRMVIMIVVIGAAIFLLGKNGLFGAVFGVLTLKLSALFWPVIHKYNPFIGGNKSR